MLRRKCHHKSKEKTDWTGIVTFSSQFSSCCSHKGKKCMCGSRNNNSGTKRNKKQTKIFQARLSTAVNLSVPTSIAEIKLIQTTRGDCLITVLVSGSHNFLLTHSYSTEKLDCDSGCLIFFLSTVSSRRIKWLQLLLH